MKTIEPAVAATPQILYSPRFKMKTQHKRKSDPKLKLFYVACFLFIIGIAIGAILVSFDDVKLLQYVNTIIKSGLESRVTEKIFITFINCLIPHLVMMLCCVLLANCTFGTPLIILLIIFKGIGAGLMGGFVYRFTGVQGILYNLFVLMPPVLISSIGFLWLCIWAVKSSIVLYAVAVKGRSRTQSNQNTELYHYLAISGILATISALSEAMLFKYLGVFFIPLH